MAGTKSPLFGRKVSGGLYAIEDRATTTGDRWFVHSGTGTDAAGYGQHPDIPVATIDYAIGLAAANNGDIIYVMPGHAENIIAAGIDVDKAGLKIIGLGVENNRPTITFTATTSDVDIDADDIYISGLRFVSNINNLAWFIDANMENLTMEDCEFVTSNTKEAYNFINLATTKDHFTFRRCKFLQPTDPDGTDHGDNTGCFYFEDSEDILIEDCVFQGEFESSIFHNKTTKAQNLWIRNCYGEQALDAADILTLVDDGTGGMVESHWLVPDASDITTEGKFVTLAATTAFGLHDVTFMNDNNAGEHLALPVTAAMG